MIKTKYCKIDNPREQKDCIVRAASILRWGGTVAFPTETVYGLGANALNVDAVAKIFKAKGRPADNPLIVHIAYIEELVELVAGIPFKAGALMSAFWPGPLTLVFKKSDKVPLLVTAGLDTVAVRMPAHPVALSLIDKARVPVAAPSANLSGKPSPTRGLDVLKDLRGRVDVVIDGGTCLVGLESTVLDLTVDPPMILRPGGISKEDIELIVGKVDIDPFLLNEYKEQKLVPKSPGMKYTHYAPQADIVVVQGLKPDKLGALNLLVEKEKKLGRRVGLILTEETAFRYRSFFKSVGVKPDSLQVLGSREEPEAIASRLYNSFRYADRQSLDVVFAEEIPAKGLGLAVMNRLLKAAGHHVVQL